MPDCMPDFLIIGAQKCGTTSLYQYLIQHPNILPAATKEVHFFDLQYARGIDWYLQQFPDRAESNCKKPRYQTGEASPYYFFHPLVPERVHRHFPQVKLIVLLRNPVDRAISHYYHEVRLGFEKLPLEAACDREAERLAGEEKKWQADPNYCSLPHQHFTYKARGNYLEQLQRWYRFFSPDRLLVLHGEAFFADPGPTLARVWDFLGVRGRASDASCRYNVGDYPPVSDRIRNKLADAFRPLNQKLFAALDRDFGWLETATSRPDAFAKVSAS